MNKAHLLAAFLLAGMTSSCATSGNPAAADPTVTSKIEKGKSTKEDVEKLLGKPQATATTKEGTEKWEYVYAKTQVTGATFIPIVGLFAGGAHSDMNGINVFFDKNNVVTALEDVKGQIETHNVGKNEMNIHTQEK